MYVKRCKAGERLYATRELHNSLLTRRSLYDLSSKTEDLRRQRRSRRLICPYDHWEVFSRQDEVWALTLNDILNAEDFASSHFYIPLVRFLVSQFV